MHKFTLLLKKESRSIIAFAILSAILVHIPIHSPQKAFLVILSFLKVKWPSFCGSYR